MRTPRNHFIIFTGTPDFHRFFTRSFSNKSNKWWTLFFNGNRIQAPRTFTFDPGTQIYLRKLLIGACNYVIFIFGRKLYPHSVSLKQTTAPNPLTPTNRNHRNTACLYTQGIIYIRQRKDKHDFVVFDFVRTVHKDDPFNLVAVCVIQEMSSSRCLELHTLQLG